MSFETAVPWMVVDSKYKKPLIEHHGDRFRNTGLYQPFAYAAELNAPAVLVYPRVDWDVNVTLEAAGSNLRIETVDVQAGVPLILRVRQGRGDLWNRSGCVTCSPTKGETQ